MSVVRGVYVIMSTKMYKMWGLFFLSVCVGYQRITIDFINLGSLSLVLLSVEQTHISTWMRACVHTLISAYFCYTVTTKAATSLWRIDFVRRPRDFPNGRWEIAWATHCGSQAAGNCLPHRQNRCDNGRTANGLRLWVSLARF